MADVTENMVDQATTDLDNNDQSKGQSFTQEDLNRIGTKEHSKGYSKALKDLGFDDAEAAKTAFKAYQDWQEAQKSDQEKQAEALTAKEKELEAVQAEKKLLEAKLSAVGLGVKAESVDDVIALAERLVSDEVAMDTAIGQVLDKYPQFGTSQEETAIRPSITATGNPSVATTDKVDPFQAIIDSYKK